MQEPRGEERCWRSEDLFARVDEWVGGGSSGGGVCVGGLFCTNKVFSKLKQRCNKKKKSGPLPPAALQYVKY